MSAKPVLRLRLGCGEPLRPRVPPTPSRPAPAAPAWVPASAMPRLSLGVLSLR
jgi:hypothetical protein